MKAIRIHEDGGPEVLRYEEVPGHLAGKLVNEARAGGEAVKA